MRILHLMVAFFSLSSAPFASYQTLSETMAGNLAASSFLRFVFYLLIRAPHLGFGKPPMYGDYEAQRHWKEITTSLPISQWCAPLICSCTPLLCLDRITFSFPVSLRDILQSCVHLSPHTQVRAQREERPAILGPRLPAADSLS